MVSSNTIFAASSTTSTSDVISALKTANYQAVASEWASMDVTSASLTVTPPTSPAKGTWFGVIDTRGKSETNPIIVSTTTNKVNSLAENTSISQNYSRVRFTYIDATVGWIVS
jgi:hypothetical protein